MSRRSARRRAAELRYWWAELAKAHLRRVTKARQLRVTTLRPGLAAARHVVVLVVHDEIERMPYLLDYYRALGFDHFAVVDNESGDGLDRLVAGMEDVSLFTARGSYRAARYGNDWINQVLRRHCVDKWALYVDADEFLVYAGSPEQPIGVVTAALEHAGVASLHTALVDMYGAEPLHETAYASGQPPLEVCPLFDTEGYVQQYEEISQTTWIKGGMRGRLFFSDVWEGPALNKTPLVRWKRHYAFIKSSHQLFPPHLNGPGPQTLAGLRGALLHFKFFAAFETKVRDEELRRQHTDEYTRYLGLARTSFVGASTARYEDWTSVAAAGLLSDRPFEPDRVSR